MLPSNHANTWSNGDISSIRRRLGGGVSTGAGAFGVSTGAFGFGVGAGAAITKGEREREVLCELCAVGPKRAMVHGPWSMIIYQINSTDSTCIQLRARLLDVLLGCGTGEQVNCTATVLQKRFYLPCIGFMTGRLSASCSRQQSLAAASAAAASASLLA